MEEKNIVAVIVVAAGMGKRMGGDRPKQFLEIGGKPILRLTLERFQDADGVDQIYVVTNPRLVDDLSPVIKDEWGIGKLMTVVAGGTERHDSVWAGLQALEEAVRIVMIHDGVRPFVSRRIIAESINAARQVGAVIVGVTPKDTVKQISDRHVAATLDRAVLLLTQTPQTFQKHIVVNAYQKAFSQNDFSTDDAALVEKLGQSVLVVQGDHMNIKITTPDDLAIANAFMERME